MSTEAIDATVNLDGAKRSNYDPDEMMEEQRERMLRKRYNTAFKDFASKVLCTICMCVCMIHIYIIHTACMCRHVGYHTAILLHRTAVCMYHHVYEYYVSACRTYV